MSANEDGPTGATLSYRKILEREMENALKEMDRPAVGTFISGFSAGLNLSFGALFMAMVLTFAGGFDSTLTKQVTLAGVSSIAFLFVVIGQTELFTAHSTMAVLPVLDGRASLRDLGQIWSVTYVSNLLGCAAFVALIAAIGEPMGIAEPSAFGSLAGALVGLPWWTITLSGVVAGWLMGMATWLSAASRDTVGRIVFVLLTTAAIGFGPFHHAILGTTEVLSAIVLDAGVAPGAFVPFIVFTTIGNVLGGTVFVALLNYGHIALAGEEKDVDFQANGIEDS
ncbi:formate/nitrite transporter family protein [Halococcus saccharolyticus]|uniref:Formate/nitrite transporter n=1 Tax=Halococcus saccharolyticus DSM 5350 TaxID=1227455 RepID=M0MET2_9EURY|nr:formate/nitrite transporter family protein [Halococcus saccharolyticus]EMA43848.1 formate/nitrite transporter [Halococcus saccharolyticus DSM 5350]